MIGLLALMAGVAVATVRGVTEQANEISTSVDKALDKAADETDALGIRREVTRQKARKAVEGRRSDDHHGCPRRAWCQASGYSSRSIASGVILGAVIMYYLLKDGARFADVPSSHRSRAPAPWGMWTNFIGDSCRILRDYGQGRTVMSAIVAVVIGLAALLMGLPLVFTIIVVNFIGGYIPYIGAFLGGGLAVLIAGRRRTPSSGHHAG